jgi:cytidylate kinase
LERFLKQCLIIKKVLDVIIVIAGLEGSGKDSVGRELARRLGYRFYSLGDIWGEMAHERGLSLQEFNALCEEDESLDRKIDQYQKGLGRNEDNFVMVSRMGAHFIPHAFKVFLDAELDERARRVFQDLENRKDEHYSDVKETRAALKKLQAGNEKRYQKLYGINPYDRKMYDLVVDATKIGIMEVVDEIMGALREAGKI